MLAFPSPRRDEELSILFRSFDFSEISASNPVVIRITENGSIFFNDAHIVTPEDEGIKDLQERLDSINSNFRNLKVVLLVDRDARFERFVLVLDICAYAHVEKENLFVQSTDTTWGQGRVE